MKAPDALRSRGTVSVVVCSPDEPTLDRISGLLAGHRIIPLPIANPAGAVRLCRYGRPQALILDLSFGDRALAVLRARRETRSLDVPVLALAPPDLDLGALGEGDDPRLLADAVLTLPVDFDDLLHRLVKVLRRSGDAVVRVGVLAIDPPRHRVTVGGKVVRLTPMEFSLLRVLASDPLRVFSEGELLREVWGWPSTSRTQTVKSHASRLRRKLDPINGRFVVNYQSIGWRLVHSLADAESVVPGDVGGGGR